MQPEGRQDGSSGLRISLLGGFSVAVGAERVPDEACRRRKPAALVRILAQAEADRAPCARVDPLKAWVAQAMTELSAPAPATGTEEVS